MREGADWRGEIARRLAGLGLPPEREAEIVEEWSEHLNENYRSLLAGGATEEEAREIALEELYARPELSAALRGVVRREDGERLALGTPRRHLAGDLWRDLRYGLRMLRRTPAFTAVAVLSLAVGIGGTAAMFRIVSAALLRPLPYPQSDRLVHGANTGYYPPGGLTILQDESRTMEVAGYSPGIELNLTGNGEPWRLRGCAVSANLFAVLREGVAMGRGFRAGEDTAGRDELVILSHSLWQDVFAGDRGVIGRVVMLGGVRREVVGVARREFAFPDTATRFWIPLDRDPRDATAYWARGFMPVVGRMRDGVSLRQARQEIASLSLRMLRRFPYPMGRDWAATMTVVPLREQLTGNFRVKLWVLQCAAGLVLLIACVNVAALLLSRAASRQKEIALRVALGASRARIARQLLTESVVLAAAGGGLGIALALAAERALAAAVMPGFGAAGGWEVVWFGAALSLATGVGFGLAPALAAARQDLTGAIKAGGPRAGGGRARLRSALIVSEVALAVVLTVSAGVLMRSLWRLAEVDPGFAAQHVLTLRVSPNQSLCARRAACIALYDELLRRTRVLPGVEEAAAASAIPLGGSIPASAVKIEGVPLVPAEHAAPMFWAGAVTPEYFRLMGIPIVRGRALDARDGERAEPAIVVSAATARRYWPGEDPIGKHVELVWETSWRKVVGVAGDVRQFDLAGRTPDFIRGAMYMPYAQAEDTDRELPASMTLVLRTNGDTARVAGGVRDLVRQMNPEVPVDEIRSMVSVVRESTRQPRSMMWLFAGFAAVALALAAVGAYGVVSYSAAQRRFEMGVRMALGAGRGRIFRAVLGESVRLVAAGLALGLAASLGVTRLLASFLYGTAPSDAATLGAVCGVLIAVAVAAGYVPARRAARVDPATVLRGD